MAIRDSVELSKGEHGRHDALRAILTAQLPGAELRSVLDGEAGYSPPRWPGPSASS